MQRMIREINESAGLRWPGSCPRSRAVRSKCFVFKGLAVSRIHSRRQVAQALLSVLAAGSDRRSNPTIESCSMIDIFSLEHETEDRGRANPHKVKR